MKNLEKFPHFSERAMLWVKGRGGDEEGEQIQLQEEEEGGISQIYTRLD